MMDIALIQAICVTVGSGLLSYVVLNETSKRDKQRTLETARHVALGTKEGDHCSRCGTALISCYSFDHYQANKPKQPNYYCTACQAHRWPISPAEWRA